MALYYRQVVELDIHFMPWDELWQTLPADLLRTDMLQSLWYFHAQPPFFNVLAGVLIKLFYPNQVEMLYVVNMLLGSLLVAMIYYLLRQLTGRSWLALGFGLLIALNPSVFLYEAYPLYTLLTAFLITLSVFCLALYAAHGRVWLLPAFIFVLNLLILTRSLYHFMILLIAIPFVLWLAEKNWRRMLPVTLLICLLSAGWYGKNWVQFNFFGSSSWLGLGLWNIVSVGYTTDELKQFVAEGVIAEPMLTMAPFDPPADFETYGFDQTSTIPAMSRNDYNNINVPAIADMYQESSLNLLRHDPGHYALNMLIAYMVYTSPPSRFYHLSDNAAKMGVHEAVVSKYVLGQAVLQKTLPFQDEAMGSIMAVLLPVNLLIYGLWVFKQNRFSGRKWLTYLRLDGVFVALVFMIVYTTAVSIMFEYVENARFQFLVEQLIWVFIIVTLWRVISQYQIHSPSQT